MIKKTILTLLATVALTAGVSAQMLDISEVYGGGGNTGSTYKNDFIELYNYGTTTINMSTLAVYYTNTTGTSFDATTPANNFTTVLSGTLAPGSYYLIQEAAGTGGTTNLPTPNATGTINLSATGGKVALGLASVTPSGAAGAVTPDGTNLIDFLGYGTANEYEGTGPAAATAAATSSSRTNPAVNAYSNSAEFATGAPSPTTSAVPEPSTFAVMALGGLGVLAMLRARRRTV